MAANSEETGFDRYEDEDEIPFENDSFDDEEREGTGSGETGFLCAGCGQWNETAVDASAGRRQSYVEDCQVCCKPNVLQIVWEQEEETYRIDSELES